MIQLYITDPWYQEEPHTHVPTHVYIIKAIVTGITSLGLIHLIVGMWRRKKVSEYDQEIPQFHKADQRTLPWERATEHWLTRQTQQIRHSVVWVRWENSWLTLLEQLVHYPTREINTFGLNTNGSLTSLPSQFQDVDWVIMALYRRNFESYYSPNRVTSKDGIPIPEWKLWLYGKRCIQICKGKYISMVNQILARFKDASAL